MKPKRRGRGRPPLDLTNAESGHLVAVRPTAVRRNRQVVWVCRCRACGNPDSRHTSSDIALKKVKDCGCTEKNPPTRQALYRKLIDKGLTRADIARRYGVSPQAVSQTLSRAARREKCG